MKNKDNGGAHAQSISLNFEALRCFHRNAIISRKCLTMKETIITTKLCHSKLKCHFETKLR